MGIVDNSITAGFRVSCVVSAVSLLRNWSVRRASCAQLLYRVSHGFKDMHEFHCSLYQGWPSMASFKGAVELTIIILGWKTLQKLWQPHTRPLIDRGKGAAILPTASSYEQAEQFGYDLFWAYAHGEMALWPMKH
jgi:hypothetical protein